LNQLMPETVGLHKAVQPLSRYGAAGVPLVLLLRSEGQGLGYLSWQHLPHGPRSFWCVHLALGAYTQTSCHPYYTISIDNSSLTQSPAPFHRYATKDMDKNLGRPVRAAFSFLRTRTTGNVPFPAQDPIMALLYLRTDGSYGHYNSMAQRIFQRSWREFPPQIMSLAYSLNVTNRK